eukprot:CAMPEP_0180554786 /NCGR_PEP_ID=MMETSP1036_2-20121128/75093_1 /TAXON_ID=632150 /ORGANISM="Azadinium spinosum, Strain 3D9" /LENGTH=183 /DNA_ID=CAMNT_0022570587 /DNA_START=48 /DNA_END=596 /DNA_ORIENTATION=+
MPVSKKVSPSSAAHARRPGTYSAGAGSGRADACGRGEPPFEETEHEAGHALRSEEDRQALQGPSFQGPRLRVCRRKDAQREQQSEDAGVDEAGAEEADKGHREAEAREVEPMSLEVVEPVIGGPPEMHPAVLEAVDGGEPTGVHKVERRPHSGQVVEQVHLNDVDQVQQHAESLVDEPLERGR